MRKAIFAHRAIVRWTILVCFLLNNFYFITPGLAAPADLVISEIMYDASGSDSKKEWLEVYNAGADAVEVLTGSSKQAWRFYDGSNHTLSLAQGTSTIASGEFFIISSDANQFLVDHPGFVATVFDTTMSLPNSSSTIALSFDGGASQSVLASYDSTWGAGGDGNTLEKINLTQDSGQNNWHVSAMVGGTPGLANSQNTNPPPSDEPTTPPPDQEPTLPPANNQGGGNSVNHSEWWQIKISEFLPNPKGTDDDEWIELYNSGANSVDLSGFKLQDNSAKVFTLGEEASLNLVLPGGSYLVLYKKITGINLNNSGGDSVKLYDPNGVTLDSISYKDNAPEAKSYARQGDNFSWTSTPTPGVANEFLVNQAPQAVIKIKTEKLLAEQTIVLSAEDSSDPEEGNLKYLWDFGDDSTGDEKTENHIYQAGGNYLVRLKVIDPEGLSTEATSMLNIPDEQSDITLQQIQSINFGPNDLIISEFLPDPVGSDDSEWVEIYNASSQNINLAGWQLDDAEGGSRPYVFNASSTIAMGGFLVVDKKTSRLSLNNQGDEVRLLTPLGEVWQTVAYEKIPEGKTQAWDMINQEWFISDQPSPGGANINQGDELQLASASLSNVKDKQIIDFTGVALGPSSTSTASLFLAELVDGVPNYESVVEVCFTKKKWPPVAVGDIISVLGTVSKNENYIKIKIKQAEDLLVTGDKIILTKPEIIEVGDLSDTNLNQYITVHGLVTKKIGVNIYLAENVGDDSIVRLATSFPTKDLQIKVGTEIITSGILSKVNDKFKLLVLDKNALSLSREVLGEKEFATSSIDVTSTPDKQNSTKNILFYIGAGVLVIFLVFWFKNRKNK